MLFSHSILCFKPWNWVLEFLYLYSVTNIKKYIYLVAVVVVVVVAAFAAVFCSSLSFL
jgi:ABC-type lipoprotein release transport system permease subunit